MLEKLLRIGSLLASTMQQYPQPQAGPQATYGQVSDPRTLLTPYMQCVATTGVGGFALQNATPTILTWTAPNDGKLHRGIILGQLNVTSPETGGGIVVSTTNPTTPSITLIAGGLAVQWTFLGNGVGTPGYTFMLQPGQTITISQSALTAGAATLYAELWAS